MNQFLLYSIFYLLPVIGAIAIAGITYVRYATRSLSFLLFVGLISIWLSLQYLAQVIHTNSVASDIIVRCAAATIAPALVFMQVFISNYTVQRSKIRSQLYLLLTLVFSPLVFLRSYVEGFKATQYGIITKNAGLLYLVQNVLVLIIVSDSFLMLIRRIRDKKQSKNEITRSKYLLFAFGQLILTNIVASLFLGDIAGAQIIIPITLLAMTIIIFTAIIRHKLFDVRLIVARALGYALTLTTVAGFYSLFIFVFLAGLLGSEKISVAQRSTYSILAVLFGFSLPPLKKFFDKLTNALFYKDAYDSQVFLDTFNKTLVGNIDLQPLLRESAELIETTLKAEYCLFGIRETENSPRRIIGTKSRTFSEEDIKETMSLTPHVHQKVIVVDDLEEHHAKLKETLSKNNVAILARLISSVNQKQGQGYLILGQKKSGNPYNKDDIQVLEIVVNELVIAIQNAMRFEEIQAFTVTLQEKVNEATRQLRKTNEKLKALDETKDEFISMASHQLRTPLTSVKGYVSMVIEGDAGKISKQQHELLGQAFASSQRMVYLIADLLNVSRLRTGKFVIENKPTQLADVIETEISQLKEAASGKHLTLTYKKPKNFPILNMDETKIRQVIMNFTDNALYYTPSGGHINLTLEDKGSTIEFAVVDDGIGVPKAEQHHLFGKFYRAGNAKKARPDGTGLGLFMAKKVIIAQGGAVVFHSEEGKGSTFGFSFPKSALKVTSAAKEVKQAPLAL